MKLRSTLLFAAASLTASALAPVAFLPATYGAGEIISLNFGKTENNVSDGLTGTAGLATYDKDGTATGVGATGWTNTTGQTGSSSTLKNYDGEIISGASVSWNGPQAPWGPGGHDTTVLGMIQSSYLDLSAGNAWTVSVDSSFLVCDVYVYLSGDGTKYAPVNINRVSYVGGENTTGSTEWGDRSTNASKTIALGTNAIKVTDCAGVLELSNVIMGDSGKRATLSGIQIVNTYTGTETSVNLDGSQTDWTNTAIGSTAWTNSTAEAGTYAAFNLTTDTTVNVSEKGITTDAITASGNGVLTLSGEEITLIGPSTVRTNSETASIVVNNTVNFIAGGVIFGNVSLGDSGALDVSGGNLLVNSSLSGKMNIAENAVISFAQIQSGTLDLSEATGTGRVELRFATDWATGWESRGVDLGDDGKFSGEIYVYGGNFALNAMDVHETLRLASGVNVSLIGGSSVTYSKNLVLEGSTQIHQNGNSNLTFDENSSVTGSGTYDRRGGGTLIFAGNVDLAGGLAHVSGSTYFRGTASLGSVNQTGGTINITGKFNLDNNFDVRGNGARLYVSDDATVTGREIAVVTGGTVAQTGGNVTVDTVRLHDKTSGAGNSTYNLSGGLLNITGTTKSNTTAAGILIGHWGSGKGILNVSGGVLNATDTWAVVSWTSPGEFTISGGEVNVGGITLQGQSGNAATVTLSGGRLNVGRGGLMTGNSNKLYKFDGGTLGALESWSSEVALTLGGNVTIDTQTRIANLTGTSTDGGIGATISLGGVVSGSGNITKSGAGTLALSGANTFTGDITVSAGTVVAGNASALGTGKVSLATGTALANGTNSTVTVGTLETVDGSTLYFGESGSADAAGFKSTNTATIATGTLFDANTFEAGKKLVEGVSQDLDVSKFTLSSLLVNGAATNSRGSVKFEVKDGILTLSEYTEGAVYNLTWAGTESENVWTSGGDATPWTKADDNGASNFETGDSVTFSDTAQNKNVKVNGVVNPAALVFTNTEGNDYIFSKADDAATAVLVGSTTINKSGSGSVKIESSVDLSRFSGNMTITEGSLIIEHTENLTVPNVLSGAGTFEKTGTGTMILEGNNDSFSGNIVVSGGLLKLGASNALGANNVSVSVKTGGTLDLNGQVGDGYYGNYTLSGGALINTGAEMGVGKRQLTGGITLTEDSEIGGTSDFGMISNEWGANTLALNSHVLTKTGTNTFYLASTTVTAGTIKIQEGTIKQGSVSDVRLQSSDTSAADFIIGTKGTFDLNGKNLSVKSLKAEEDGTVHLGGGTLTLLGESTLTRITSAGTVSVADNVTLTTIGGRFNTAQFTLGNNSKLNLQGDEANFGSVISGDGWIIKDEVGKITLTATNTYTGKTTVSAGTLGVTKAEALGSGALEVGKDGTLELAFGGTFSREIVGIGENSGTLAKSGAEELTYSGAFSGSFNVKEGILSVDVANGSYKNLSISSGATFKAKKDLVFESVSNATGTLSGETENTRVSVTSGAFAGTLSSVSLVKAGAGTLDFSGAKFAAGGSVVVEGGTVSNLKLADSGTLYLSAPESSDITLSNLTISDGTIRIGQLWDTDVQATIADSFVVESGATLTLFIEQLTLGANQAVFTFTSDTKSAWETAFGTLTTDGKFTGGTGTLTLAGLGTYESGVFSWNENTLYFKENREAKDFVWTKTDYYGNWSGENWNDPKEAFQSGMNAVFNESSVSEKFAQQGYEKGAYVVVDEDVFTAEITVNAGADSCVSISEGGGKLSASKGISVESGALYFYASSSDFYTGEFKIAETGTVILGQPVVSGVDPLNLRASFSGTGTIQYGTAEKELTLSGDRSQFTGTLDVNAGTVVLANGTGTEAFTSIDIAEGAVVAANGGAAVDGFSTLTLNQVSGTGTLNVSAQGATFFALDLSGSGFTGTVELNAVDMVLATNSNEPEVTSVSNLANASSVRLTNNASLNFFNTASTFDKNIEVAEKNGAIRVYGNNTGTTLSGNISGTGTLTVKDGGKLILSGAVGTADSALGGLTLSAGSLEISGENSSINISGNVALAGASATINTNGTISGNLVSGAWGVLNPLTLGGNLSIGGNVTFVGTGQQGRVTTILENAKISVAGTTSFEDNEAITIGTNATLDSTTITSSQWGFNATLGAGATLSAGTLTFGKNTDSVSGAAEGDASRIEIGTEDGTGTLTGTVVVKDVTIGVREGATAWSSNANLTNLKFNGGTTTFDVGEGQEITLNGTITEAVETATGEEGQDGYVAATSSALVKDGAGTLTLGKASANKGGTQINAGTLKFTNATDGVTLSGSYAFAGGTLVAGEGTTLTIGAGATFSGAVVYTNDKNGKLLVSEDFSVTGEGNSLTLHEKANVEIASGKTLSLSALGFTGNGSKIEGSGTLSLAGTVTVDNNRTNTITSELALSEDSVLAISKGTLEIESEDISTNGKTLTKTGAGTLTLDTDAVYDFDGSFILQGGTVDIGSRELTISGTHNFELASKATLEGDLVLEKGSSAMLGAGTIKGDVTLSGAALSFTGKTTVEGALSWTDSNTITLDAEFRKTITSTPYTLISFGSKEGDNANLTFTDVETYGRRSFTLDISDTKIDLLATGTLVWNANVATWTTDAGEEADWTLEQTAGNTTSAFIANDYVEFRDSGSIVIADNTIQTSGVVFNIADGGTFRLNAPTPATDGNGRPVEAQKTVTLTDAVYGDNNTTGKSAGLTVVAGNVTIGNYIVNDLSSVTISSGSLTVFNVDALGIVDKTDSANEKIATLTIGGGVNDDGTPKSATLNISLPGDDAKTEDVNESVGVIDQKVAVVNAGVISVVNANTTVEISGAVSGVDAKLTKTGWGALKITRDSTLGALAVDSGYLELVGNADTALSIKSVEVGNQGEMALVGDTDGANTTFEAITVNGTLKVTDGNAETPGSGAYRTGTLQGNNGNISGNLYIGADTGFDITTNNTDGTTSTTNYKGTAVSGNLTLTGSIASYGTEDAALYKKGTETLTLVSAEKDEEGNESAFKLDATVIHEAGTLAFTHGGVISENYTIAENASATLRFNGANASELSTGLTLGAGSRTTIENAGNGTLEINGISTSGTTATTLAGKNITLSGDTVDFGSLTKIDENTVLSALYVNAENVKVDAKTFTAGYVAFGNGASLAISSGTTATANALYVGENASATLDLTGGAKFSVGSQREISVFGGTGTLNVAGGTLELMGATFDAEDAPSIVLKDATLAFNVTESDVTVAAYLDGVSTADGSTGTIEKTGTGTLMVMEGLVDFVFGGGVQDLSFDGEISVEVGGMTLFATASQAEVEIADGAALEFAGIAELADSIDGVNTLAESLSGAGTLYVAGELYVNANSGFDGTIKASGGTLYVSGATSDWMANGTNRVLAVESGIPLVGTEKVSGKVATYDESATLTTVSLSGRGTFLGAAEDKTLTVREVSATAGSVLTLQGYGTLGAMKFAEEASANLVTVAEGANWTIDGVSENLKQFYVYGTATIADAGALGDASVAAYGKIIFDAEGTYANEFGLFHGAVIEAKKKTSLTGKLEGPARTVTFVADENAKLTLSDSVIYGAIPMFETKDTTATIAVDVTSSDKTLSAHSKFSGVGTFEKLGDKKLSISADAGTIGAVAVTAGTLDFGANGKLAVSEGGAGTLSVADRATLKLAGTKLGDWTLTGDGSAEISGSGNALKAISSAKNVSLSGTLGLTGNISDSKITFGSADAKLTTAGTAAQSIAGSTFSGETITFVNENKAGVTVASDTTFDAASVKALVLTAGAGIKGGEVSAAFAGSLTKTLDGEWTVSDYTFGKTADQKLTVSGGTLVWKGMKLEANAGAIQLGDSATLKINGLASGDTLRATIDGSGTLEIAATGTSADPLNLETTAANNSAWKLHVSEASYVKTDDMLPGDLWVEGKNSVFELALAASADETVSGGKRYQVSKDATLKLSGAGTLTLEDTGNSKNPHSVSGILDVAAGTFVQSGNIQWDPNATVNIGENGKVSIDISSVVNNNNATFTGTGTLEIAKTGATPYRFGGKTAGFEGEVSIADGAKAELFYELFDNADVEVQGELTVAISGTEQKNRTLKNISGAGTLVIDTPVDFYTRYGIYTYATNSNTFAGTVDVKSGVLSVDAADLGNLKASKVEIGGTKKADYYEGSWAGEHWDGITAGGFLRLKNGNDFDAASLFADSKFNFRNNAGTIYSRGSFKANSDFGSGKDSLFVVDAATTLTLTNGADIDGSLLVKHDGVLVVDYTVAGSGSGAVIRANSATDGNSGITGDLTLNGDLRIVVTDDAINNGALFGVGGKVALSTDGGNATKIELEVTGTEDLDGKRVIVLGGKYDGNTDLNGIVEVTDTNGNKYKVARDANGQIVILNSATEYTNIPSGLSELATVIRDAKSPLWDYVQADLAQSENRLVGLSPVSYGSLVEMQSGFAALENDLLRERLEQRRYERAFISDREKTFKPFVNLVGSEREGDGNGTESANYDISHTGLLGGFDVAVSRNTIFGVSLGFDFAKADVHNGGGKHEGDSTRLGVYGMTVFDNAYFGYGVSAGATSFETKRNSGYNGESLTGTTDGKDINASFLLGAGWTLDENLGIDIAPYVGLDFGYASTQSFAEEGGKQSALDIDRLERLSLRGKLGATLSWRTTDRLRLSLDAAFSHEFLDSDIDIDATFAKGDLKGKSFSSTAYLMDENTIQIGPRVDYRIDDTWSVSGGYSYETDLDDTVTHSANVGFRARF